MTDTGKEASGVSQRGEVEEGEPPTRIWRNRRQTSTGGQLSEEEREFVDARGAHHFIRRSRRTETSMGSVTVPVITKHIYVGAAGADQMIVQEKGGEGSSEASDVKGQVVTRGEETASFVPLSEDPELPMVVPPVIGSVSGLAAEQSGAMRADAWQSGGGGEGAQQTGVFEPPPQISAGVDHTLTRGTLPPPETVCRGAAAGLNVCQCTPCVCPHIVCQPSHPACRDNAPCHVMLLPVVMCPAHHACCNKQSEAGVREKVTEDLPLTYGLKSRGGDQPFEPPEPADSGRGIPQAIFENKRHNTPVWTDAPFRPRDTRPDSPLRHLAREDSPLRHRNARSDSLPRYRDTRPDSPHRRQATRPDSLSRYRDTRPDSPLRHLDRGEGSPVRHRNAQLDSLPTYRDTRPDSPLRRQATRPDSLCRYRDTRPDSPLRHLDRGEGSPLRHPDAQPDSFPTYRDPRPDSPLRHRATRPDSHPRYRDTRPDSPLRHRATRPDSLPRYRDTRPDSPLRHPDRREDAPLRPRTTRPDSPFKHRDAREAPFGHRDAKEGASFGPRDTRENASFNRGDGAQGTPQRNRDPRHECQGTHKYDSFPTMNTHPRCNHSSYDVKSRDAPPYVKSRGVDNESQLASLDGSLKSMIPVRPPQSLPCMRGSDFLDVLDSARHSAVNVYLMQLAIQNKRVALPQKVFIELSLGGLRGHSNVVQLNEEKLRYKFGCVLGFLVEKTTPALSVKLMDCATTACSAAVAKGELDLSTALYRMKFNECEHSGLLFKIPINDKKGKVLGLLSCVLATKAGGPVDMDAASSYLCGSSEISVCSMCHLRD